MASFRKNFKPTVDEKMKTFLTLYDYIKENKTSCIDCENLEVKNVERFGTTKYSSVCKISGECVLYPKYCNNYKFSDKTKRNIINCWIDILKEKEGKRKMMIKDYIGEPALLEQFAEECNELAQASLKYARKLRGENPTPKTEQEILDNLHEEIADVLVCLDELTKTGKIDCEYVMRIKQEKRKRWKERVKIND